LIYVSPEMALSDGFRNQVWKNPRFRSRLAAIFVDEAHVINEWGEEEFRPEYRELGKLWSYCGYTVPMVASTATCQTSTFNLLWKVL
ncbi:hypothetical protein BT96DRAFT_839534, partial [Gymnopus androsaceus JB14]